MERELDGSKSKSKSKITYGGWRWGAGSRPPTLLRQPSAPPKEKHRHVGIGMADQPGPCAPVTDLPRASTYGFTEKTSQSEN